MSIPAGMSWFRAVWTYLFRPHRRDAQMATGVGLLTEEEAEARKKDTNHEDSH